MPNSQLTEFGNVVVKARVDSRSTRSTFIVGDFANATRQTITREEYDRVAAEQDKYLAGADVVVVAALRAGLRRGDAVKAGENG
jgi:hypothetical protein